LITRICPGYGYRRTRKTPRQTTWFEVAQDVMGARRRLRYAPAGDRLQRAHRGEHPDVGRRDRRGDFSRPRTLISGMPLINARMGDW